MASISEEALRAMNLCGSSLAYAAGVLLLFVLVSVVLRLGRMFLRLYADLEAVKAFPGPPGSGLMGNTNDFYVTVGQMELLTQHAKKYSPAYKVRLGAAVAICLIHPSYISVVTSTADGKGANYQSIRPWIGDGLLLSSGRKWTRNRRLLTPAFHFDILIPYIATYSESTRTLVNRWKTDGEQIIEMFDSISLLTLDSLLKCIFGNSSAREYSGNRHPYIKTVHKITKAASAQNRSLLASLMRLFSGREFRKACRSLHAFTRGVIQQRKEDRNNLQHAPVNKKRYLDFIDILLEARDEDGVGLGDREIQEEVDTFMFEGHDTTASGLSWCLYNLACHPQYQKMCRKEVMDVIGDRDSVLCEDLAKFPYLTMCLKESLRICPPVPNISRKLTQCRTLPDGRTLSEGMTVNLSIFQLHHNPDVWPNPEMYDPERFNDENTKGRHPHAYLPFSAGPRNCIGKHFAMNEMKTVLALVLKNFELMVDETRPPQPISRLTLRSVSGIWLKVKSVNETH